MKDIVQNISPFQEELLYNLNHHREKFLHFEHNLGKAVKTLNLSTSLTRCSAAKTKGYGRMQYMADYDQARCIVEWEARFLFWAEVAWPWIVHEAPVDSVFQRFI